LFRFDQKIFLWPLTKMWPTKVECSKNIAMRDEQSKAALLKLCVETHAELLGVSRENLTIHNSIN